MSTRVALEIPLVISYLAVEGVAKSYWPTEVLLRQEPYSLRYYQDYTNFV